MGEQVKTARPKRKARAKAGPGAPPRAGHLPEWEAHKQQIAGDILGSIAAALRALAEDLEATRADLAKGEFKIDDESYSNMLGVVCRFIENRRADHPRAV